MMDQDWEEEEDAHLVRRDVDLVAARAEGRLDVGVAHVRLPRELAPRVLAQVELAERVAAALPTPDPAAAQPRPSPLPPLPPSFSVWRWA